MLHLVLTAGKVGLLVLVWFQVQATWEGWCAPGVGTVRAAVRPVPVRPAQPPDPVPATTTAKPCSLVIKMLPGTFPQARQVQSYQNGMANGTRTEVLVGQRIKLEGIVYGTNGQKLAVQERRWIITGRYIKDWVADPEGSTLVEVTELDQPKVDFCWVDSGLQLVTFEVKYQGETYQATAFFNIFAPTVTVTSETTKVTVDNRFAAFKGLTALHFGRGVNLEDPADNGITFTRTVTTQFPSSLRQTKFDFVWVQTSSIDLELRGPRVRISAETQGNLSGALGTCSNCSPEKPAWAFARTYPANPHQASYSPAIELPLDCNQAFLNAHSYEMVTMFRARTNGAVWVPLNVVGWAWKAEAAFFVSTMGWTGSGIHTMNPMGMETKTYPRWNGRAKYE